MNDHQPDLAVLTGNPAYDAVYAYIRGLGDHLPPDPVHRNAIIWRAVHAALDAVPGTCDATEVIDLGLTDGPSSFGPCILRNGHDGPGHKGANGAQWWHRDEVAHTANPEQPEPAQPFDGAALTLTYRLPEGT